MSERPASSRGNPAMADVVRSVAVLGGIVVVLWLVGQFFTNTPADPIGDDVEYSSVATSAQQAAEYQLLAPESLPSHWRANGVRFTPGSTQAWHLGVLTDDNRYIGLEQERIPLEDMLDKHAEDAKETGEVEIGGVVWRLYEGPEKRITIVRETPEVTTLITTSTAPREDFDRYVASLSAEAPPTESSAAE